MRLAKWKFRARRVIGLLVLLLLLGATYLIAVSTFHQVCVTNHSDQTISRCVLTVCSRDYVIEKLVPGATRQISFIIDKDSGYRLRYHFLESDREFLSEEAGYVCAGLAENGKPDSFRIYDDRLEFTDPLELKLKLPIEKVPISQVKTKLKRSS